MTKYEELNLLATTTSTADSGLLGAILGDFEHSHQVRVDVIAVGTGQALALGRAGDADVLLVHARDREEAFLAEGHGSHRQDVMFNDFVLGGPREAPADTGSATDILQALQRVAVSGAIFVSRGDDSGTHSREVGLWKLSGVEPNSANRWYHAVGQGMGATLIYANERGAYTLTDRGTFLAQSRTLPGLSVHVGAPSIGENRDRRLRNNYGVLVVSGAKPGVNAAKATAFAQWIVSAEVQKKIAAFRSPRVGQPLFVPRGQGANLSVPETVAPAGSELNAGSDPESEPEGRK